MPFDLDVLILAAKLLLLAVTFVKNVDSSKDREKAAAAFFKQANDLAKRAASCFQNARQTEEELIDEFRRQFGHGQQAQLVEFVHANRKVYDGLFDFVNELHPRQGDGILDEITRMLHQLQVGNADQANQILENIKQRFQICADQATELLKLFEAEQNALSVLRVSGVSDMEARHQQGKRKAQKKEKKAKDLDHGGSVFIGLGVASGILTAAALIPSPIQPACAVARLVTAIPTAVVATGALVGGSLFKIEAHLDKEDAVKLHDRLAADKVQKDNTIAAVKKLESEVQSVKQDVKCIQRMCTRQLTRTTSADPAQVDSTRAAVEELCSACTSIRESAERCLFKPDLGSQRKPSSNNDHFRAASSLKGECRGLCSGCGEPVWTSQERSKDSLGKYWHDSCLNRVHWRKTSESESQ
eukprot:SAG31_NODE_4760_length_2973_cov_3.074113_3_plen_414_part_00